MIESPLLDTGWQSPDSDGEPLMGCQGPVLDQNGMFKLQRDYVYCMNERIISVILVEPI